MGDARPLRRASRQLHAPYRAVTVGLAHLRARLASGRWSPWAEGLMLAGVVMLLFAYHYQQARGRVTPYIFIDELLRAEAAQAVAETGSPEVRGTVRWLGVVHAYVLAPAWMLPGAGAAWAATKAIGVAAAVLVAVPVYLLVRSHAGVIAALASAAAAALVPAIFWGSTTMGEPVALLLVSVAALATVKYIETDRPIWLTALSLVVVLGVGVRGQLAIVAVAALGAIATAMLLSRHRRPRAYEVALAGGLLVLSLTGLVLRSGNRGLGERASVVWEDPIAVVEALGREVGTLAAVTWVVPVVALVAATAWTASAEPRRRALGVTLAWFAAIFLAYTALKAVSLSRDEIQTVLEERNLIYLEPLAIAAVAPLVARTRPIVAAGSAAIVGLAIWTTPFEWGIGTEIPESPGLLWIRGVLGDRLDLHPAAIPLMLVLAVIAAVVLWWPRARAAPVVLVLGAALLWSGTYVYEDDHRRSQANSAQWLADGRSWVDEAAGDEAVTLVVANEYANPLPLWLTTFWNTSIDDVVDIDSSGRFVASVSATGIAPDGEIPVAPDALLIAPTALSIPGERLVANPASGSALIRSDGEAAVAARVTGRAPDGWMGASAVVQRFAPGPAGTVEIPIERGAAFTEEPRTVEVVGGTAPASVTVAPRARALLRVKVPRGPWTLQLTVDETAKPSERLGTGDTRDLGVVLGPVRVPGIEERL